MFIIEGKVHYGAKFDNVGLSSMIMGQSSALELQCVHYERGGLFEFYYLMVLID